MLSEDSLQKKVLVDIKLGVLIGTGEQMAYTVSALAVSAAPSTSANVTVKVDGKVVDFPDQEPTIVNNRTLVPVRFIAESLGYDVEWNPTDNSAVIDGGKIWLVGSCV